MRPIGRTFLCVRSSPMRKIKPNPALAALDKDQKAQAAFEFGRPGRTDWHFIPGDREGLPIKAMATEQRALAFGLLETGPGPAATSKPPRS